MEYQVHEESPRVLVVDDEKVIREILSDFLTMEGYVVRTVEDGDAALRELERRSYNLVISDLKMPGMGGLELLEKIADLKANVLTVIMTGFGTVETAIEAMKKGAYDYILKPFKIEEVVHVVERGLDRQRLHAENIRLKEAVSLYKISEAIAQSLSLDTVLDVILDAVLIEAQADVVDADAQGSAHRPVRRAHAHAIGPQADGGFTGELNLAEVLEHYRADRPLLAHGLRRSSSSPSRPRTSGWSRSARSRSRCRTASSACSTRTRTRAATSSPRGSARCSRSWPTAPRCRSRTRGCTKTSCSKNARLTTVNAVARRQLPRHHHRLRPRARGVGQVHARPLRARRLLLVADRARASRSPSAETERIVQAGLMHDIGKIGIRYEKLNKPGKLTPEEVAMFRTHPAKGKRILEPIPSMAELIPGAWCHHENWDGSGYPRGLIGDNIPLLGRIVAIADTYDAMTSDRSYRKALPHDVAIAELERCAGAQFDPELVPTFIRMIEEHRKQQIAAGNEVPR